MQLKDQLRVRMEELGMTPTELGRRIGVAGQTVRCWINGRNFPNKKLTADIERELSFKLDYSEGATQHSNTVSDSVKNSAINALAAFNKLPAPVQMLFHMLIEAYERNDSAPRQEAKMTAHAIDAFAPAITDKPFVEATLLFSKPKQSNA